MVSKYDWGTACRYFPGFKDTPGVIRLAWELCELYREEFGCAYPTRETLSQNLGAPLQSVSKWVGLLAEGGAITCVPIGRLPPEIRAQIGRSARRAQVYVLNLGWAFDVLRMREENIAEEHCQKVTAPRPFNWKGHDTAISKGHDTVTSKGRDTVTLIPYEHTLDHTLLEKGAHEGSDLGAYTREEKAKNAYATAKGRAA
jgi:hypothetical protein